MRRKRESKVRRERWGLLGEGAISGNGSTGLLEFVRRKSLVVIGL